MNNFFELTKIKARNIKRSLRRNLEAIWMCMLILSPFLSLYFERKKYSIIAQLFAIVLAIFLMYLDQYNYNKPSIEGMPIMRKKLAYYEKSTDTIVIKKEDFNEVANYILDLQEYFEERGML